jgi:hypothetical protein
MVIMISLVAVIVYDVWHHGHKSKIQLTQIKGVIYVPKKSWLDQIIASNEALRASLLKEPKSGERPAPEDIRNPYALLWIKMTVCFTDNENKNVEIYPYDYWEYDIKIKDSPQSELEFSPYGEIMGPDEEAELEESQVSLAARVSGTNERFKLGEHTGGYVFCAYSNSPGESFKFEPGKPVTLIIRYKALDGLVESNDMEVTFPVEFLNEAPEGENEATNADKMPTQMK